MLERGEVKFKSVSHPEIELVTLKEERVWLFFSCPGCQLLWLVSKLHEKDQKGLREKNPIRAALCQLPKLMVGSWLQSPKPNLGSGAELSAFWKNVKAEPFFYLCWMPITQYCSKRESDIEYIIMKVKTIGSRTAVSARPETHPLPISMVWTRNGILPAHRGWILTDFESLQWFIKIVKIMAWSTIVLFIPTISTHISPYICSFLLH